MDRLKGSTDLEDLAKRFAFDKLHHQIRCPGIIDDLVDRHDVWVPEFQAHATLAQKLLDLNDLIAVPTPQNLDRHHLARIAMNRAKDPSKRSGTDHVQDFIRPVIVA